MGVIQSETSHTEKTKLHNLTYVESKNTLKKQGLYGSPIVKSLCLMQSSIPGPETRSHLHSPKKKITKNKTKQKTQ